MLDYIVVGFGLAGMSFCETLERNGKRFVVYDNDSQVSSRVAGGLYNPVILKRFTLAWKADDQLAMLSSFYGAIEKKLGITIDHPLPVWRRFATVEEQNLWFEAADRATLSTFLSPEVLPNKNTAIDAPYGYGEVLRTGRIAVAELLDAYREYLLGKAVFFSESFDFDKLQVESGVSYKGIKARKIVFAEGYGMKKNPFFNYLPLSGTKGEYLTVEAPGLQEEKAIKANIFSIYRIHNTRLC